MLPPVPPESVVEVALKEAELYPSSLMLDEATE
jgi:hypothetical protein